MFSSSNAAIPLEISLLGGCGLRVQGRDLIVPRKARALLAYLASHPTHPTARDIVAKLLWPLNSAAQARHSLRQSLLELRRVFAAADIAPLQADATTLRLISGHVRVDIDQFQALAGATGMAELTAVE